MEIKKVQPMEAKDTPSDNESRTNTTFITTVGFTEYEKVLAERFGERFLKYREDYKKSLNYDKNGFVPDFPITVTFEPINRCNLRCTMCYTDHHKKPKATLGEDTFQQVMDECKEERLPALVIGLGSEALLHKDIKEFFDKAIDAQVMDIFFGTNGVLMDEAMCEFLVQKQVARVEVSLDAATPETYLRVRSKDELRTVEKNVHKLIEIKSKHNSKFPIIRLCFCVLDINKHEQKDFINKWEGLVDYIDLQQEVDFSYVNELCATGTVAHMDSLAELSTEKIHCAYPFNSLNVFSDGTITPCCNFHATHPSMALGNVHKDKLVDVWNGDRINKIRQELLSGEPNPVCRVCLGERSRC